VCSEEYAQLSHRKDAGKSDDEPEQHLGNKYGVWILGEGPALHKQ